MAVKIPNFSYNAKRFEKYRAPKWTTVFDKCHTLQFTVTKLPSAEEFDKVKAKANSVGSNLLTEFADSKGQKVTIPETYSLIDPFANVPDLNVEKLKDCSKSSDESLSSIKRKEGENTCICHRPTSIVSCLSCGHICSGRARRVCSIHPKRMDLMDVNQCWRCLSINIWEEE